MPGENNFREVPRRACAEANFPKVFPTPPANITTPRTTTGHQLSGSSAQGLRGGKLPESFSNTSREHHHSPNNNRASTFAKSATRGPARNFTKVLSNIFFECRDAPNTTGYQLSGSSAQGLRGGKLPESFSNISREHHYTQYNDQTSTFAKLGHARAGAELPESLLTL